MKKIAIIVVAAVAIALLGLFGFASTRPDTYHVERSRTVAASPADAYAMVSDFKRWDAWSPWSKLDPNQKVTQSGDAGTVGHSHAWVGNKDVGSGKMVITAVEAPSKVEIALSFYEPFASEARTKFVVETDGDKAKVTWAMDGDNNLLGKVMGLFMDMDTMIGKDFESGLANLDGELAKAKN